MDYNEKVEKSFSFSMKLVDSFDRVPKKIHFKTCKKQSYTNYIFLRRSLSIRYQNIIPRNDNRILKIYFHNINFLPSPAKLIINNVN